MTLRPSVKGKKKDVAEVVKHEMKKLKKKWRKKGLELSVTENGKEGKSKMIASCLFLENELSQISKEQGVTLADSVETLGVDLRERKSEKKKCKVRLSIIKKNKAFPEEPHERGCQEVVACGHDASKNMWSPCGWDVSHRG